MDYILAAICILSSIGVLFANTIFPQEADAKTKEPNNTYSNVLHFVKRDVTDEGFCPSYKHSKFPEDCLEIRDLCPGVARSGEFYIQPKHYSQPFLVYCDQDTGIGGWTVIQRRVDGSIDFERTWEEYRNGFGYPVNEFWLGNEKIFHLAIQRKYKLRVDMVNHLGDSYYAEYDSFRLAEERLNYKLLLGAYSGNAGNSFDHHYNQSFSTKDRDNDVWDSNCAVSHGGGWWFGACDHSNLNGIYGEGGETGLEWTNLPGGKTQLKKAVMKLRPMN